MVPSTWLSVVFFLILVAPGLLFDLLSERRRVGASESAFREGSRVVLASLFFSGVAVGVLILVRTLQPGLVPDPGRLFAHQGNYLAHHYVLVVVTLVVEAIIALAAAAVAHWVLVKKGRGGASLRPVSAWRKALRYDAPTKTVPHVRVRLSNGTVYTGQVAHYTADLATADREIVLCPPIFCKRAGGRQLSPMPIEYQRLILAGKSIETIAVQYLPEMTDGVPKRGGLPRHVWE